MIVCSHCLHHNLNEGANCEACGSSLTDKKSCPNCGSTAQDDARFCGVCGFNLQLSMPQRLEPIHDKGTSNDLLLPEPPPPEPTLSLSSVGIPATQAASGSASLGQEQLREAKNTDGEDSGKDFLDQHGIDDDVPNTQIQVKTRTTALLHVQSNSLIDLSGYQKVVHIGKPNDRVPPDINVSVFPSSEVVSRVHADIHLEGGNCFVEDVGSANGTYLNNTQLPPGTRHPLRNGDRICLGKGDLVTFICQMN
jgi:FHA domain/Double zinc ribbon